jgi:uncharacterized protein YjbI with pentapeptide repeats
LRKQDGAEPTIKRRRSRQTQKQNGTPLALLRPLDDDKEAWKAYWEKQGQPWRTEPEIGLERQKHLTERLGIKADIKQGIYPFKDIHLSRTDVEWLLAMHENGRGPVLWDEEKDKPEHERRTGLDLRGAELRQASLSSLPLAQMRSGLTDDEWLRATQEQRNMAAVQLQKADLSFAHLQGAILNKAQLQGAVLLEAQLQKASLVEAQLQKALLMLAQLQEANLNKAQLEEADLSEVQLEGATLREAQLEGADLREAQLESVHLNDATLSDERHGTVLLADIKWGQVNLAVIDWGHVRELGDEQVAQQDKDGEGERKDKQTRINEYKNAVRANRQLAVVLREQGLNEEADHFAYHAQILQRVVLRWQQQYGKWLFSVFLAALTGYGYRIWRILIAYGLIVFLCATAYYVLGLYNSPHLSLLQALLESITAFHGRVFTEFFNSNTPLVWVTVFEAIAGLVIEGVFIAMLTLRFFGK